MSQKQQQQLFSVPKIPLFLDSYSPGMEKRRGEEVKIVTLTLRVQPFDAKLATAIDEGLGDSSGVRAGLFKLSSAEPKPHIKGMDFRLDCPRQQLQIYASTDTETARIAFDQVKISGTYARDQKDVAGYAFILKASFGPVGREELEYLHGWFRTQRAVTFVEAEPSLAFEDEDGDPEEQPDGGGRPKPMFEDDRPDSMSPEGQKAKATTEKTPRTSRKTAKRGKAPKKDV